MTVTDASSTGMPSAARRNRAASTSSGIASTFAQPVGGPSPSATRTRPGPRGGRRVVSGSPLVRSRMPVGTGTRRADRRSATAGRDRTRLPRRPSASAIPRRRSSEYALATVAGLTCRSNASTRTGGSGTARGRGGTARSGDGRPERRSRFGAGRAVTAATMPGRRPLILLRSLRRTGAITGRLHGSASFLQAGTQRPRMHATRQPNARMPDRLLERP